MKTITRLLMICMLFGLILVSEGCAGCSHRHRRARQLHNERTERSARYDSDDDRSDNPKGRRNKDYTTSNYTSEDIQSLAEGNDYDAMLQAMFAQLNELKGVKKEYFRGNMADKEAEKRVNEIKQKYAPVYDKLSEASSSGELNYNQHKKQIKLFGEYQKLLVSILSRLGSDIKQILD